MTTHLNEVNPICRLCELEEETPTHIITQCEVLWPTRAEAFQLNFLSPTEPYWSVGGLVRFLDSATVKELVTQNNE